MFDGNKKAIADFDYINSKLKNSGIFGALNFNGFQTENRTYQQSDGYYAVSINGVPKGNKWDKMPQPQIVGNQVEGDIDFADFEGLVVGEAITSLSAYRQNKSREDRDIFVILKRKTDGRKYIYYLAEQLDSTNNANNKSIFWKNITPLTDFWLPTRLKNPKYQNSKTSIADTEFYNLKGEFFDYVNYKNKLYICSGQENYLGENGYGSILEFDGFVWNSIPTGKAGLIITEVKPDESILDEEGKFIDPKYLIEDSQEEFNPSIISTYGDRLVISGAEANPIQVKVGEWSNPRNFTVNILNGTNTIVNLTPKDTIRCSSFILPAESNNVTGMKEFNNSLYISTENGWYVWSLIPSKLSNGSFFELDRIQTDKYAPAGAINQESILTYKNDLLYISNYQIFPEFSKLTLTGSGSNVYAQYRKLTQPIDTFLSYQNFDNSCVGYFKEQILIGFDNFEGETKCLMLTPYYDPKGNEFYNYTIIDTLQPTSFLTNKRALYYTQRDTGYVYKLKPNLYSNIDTKPSTATLTSYIDGFNYKSPKFKSIKYLKGVQIIGFFSKGTEISITFSTRLDPNNSSVLNKDDCGKLFTYTHTFEDENSVYDVSKDLGFSDPNYRFGAKYYDDSYVFEKAQGIDMIYNTLVYQIEIKTNDYFSLEGCIFSFTEEGDSGDNKKTLKLL